MTLSIIICTYNTERRLLEECLRSLTESTLFHAEVIGRSDISVELLMIDDGSAVDYADLMEKYSVRHVKTENRGILLARALGVSLAVGDYLAFCDSDDTVSFNYHLPMLLRAEQTGADIVVNDWAYSSRSGLSYCRTDSTIARDFDVAGDSVLPLFFEREGREHSYYVLWNKLYRRELLLSATEATRRATEGFSRFNYSEDALINLYAFSSAKRVLNIHTGYYFYRIHDAQSVSVSSEDTLRSQIYFMSHTLSVMEREIAPRPDVQTLVGRIAEWRALMSRAHYSHAKASSYKELYPYIAERYGVRRLKRSTYRDESVYLSCKHLPDNMPEIDRLLLSVWRSGGEVGIRKSRFEYINRTAEFMRERGVIRTNALRTEADVPVAKTPLKRKIRYNSRLLRLARILFPKGSKIRKFLKNRL